MSSRYIPLLPKDLCLIPLRPVDEDSLGNMNKRSRSKGRFPFHLPAFLNKRRLFSTKGSSTTSKARNGKFTFQLINSNIFTFVFLEPPANAENSVEESDGNNPSVDNKTSRQRFKRQTATDVIPLVEFHDALSQSATFNSDIKRHS